MQELLPHQSLLENNCTTKVCFPNSVSTRHQSIAIFAMMIITISSNYLVEIPIGKWLTWGAFTYPFSFLVSELMNRLHGPKKARQVVYIGFGVAVFLAFSWMNRRIALASSAAFLLGQLLDISVFNKFRRRTWWLAPCLASITASLIDTIIFFSMAFIGTDEPWIRLAVGDFGVKLSMDLCLLLPFRMILWRSNPS